ncbi:MAG: hypothetical protein AAF467_26830 [Actinomycetota bacterium]
MSGFEDLTDQKIDRRSMIKKTAIGVGVAWTAPMVLSSAAAGSVNHQNCYFAKRHAGKTDCENRDESPRALAEVTPTMAGCGEMGRSLEAFTVTAEMAEARVKAPCLIKEIHVGVGPDMDGRRKTFPGDRPITARVTREGDAPEGRPIIDCCVVWCCPTNGTLDLFEERD